MGYAIADDNLGSLKTFTNIGDTVDAEVAQPPGSKAKLRYALVRRRREWSGGA